MIRILIKLFVAIGLLAPLAVPAQPSFGNIFMFTERRGDSPVGTSDYTFLVGSTSILHGGLTAPVNAIHLGSGPDYTLGHFPHPLFPDLYAARSPYSGQTGQWTLSATDASGTMAINTHVLQDPRDLPLITGLTVTGSPLAPHLAWDAVDVNLFPSFCAFPCALGTDFFSYQVEVRLAMGNGLLVYQSSFIPTQTSISGEHVATPTGFDLPAGILSAGNDYMFGIRLNHADLEAFLPGGGFFAPVENRSVAYAVAAIPEPETYALLLAGLGLLGFAARRRRAALASS